jgi:hypothetical protein
MKDPPMAKSEPLLFHKSFFTNRANREKSQLPVVSRRGSIDLH